MARESMVKPGAVVAGHICLDVIPSLAHLTPGKFAELFRPGQLVTTGPVLFSTGGAVSNTGLALHRLGIPTRLIARVGADPFGQIVREMIERHGPALASRIAVDSSASTSYSVIISPPEMDRIFLHCSGANDRFQASDVDDAALGQASLFHFGYPPAMRAMYQDEGAELVEIFRRAKAAGCITSLDMSYPDPSSESGQEDWRRILASALPYVDLFLPSYEEILFMLRPDDFARQWMNIHKDSLVLQADAGMLDSLSTELLDMGARIVVIKLGERGLYLRSAGRDPVAQVGRRIRLEPLGWADQTLWAPAFDVNVVGTTGAGDASIAGFLAALMRGQDARRALTAAAAVGGCNVEAADALSGIQSWEATMQRIAVGWNRRPLKPGPGWQWDEKNGLWACPGSASI